jgi:hypothetical protein
VLSSNTEEETGETTEMERYSRIHNNLTFKTEDTRKNKKIFENVRNNMNKKH